MDKNELRVLLEAYKEGAVTEDEIILKIKEAPFEDLGYARIDTHRGLRQGVNEVIYGAGKTPEQVLGIARAMREKSDRPILITRMKPDAVELMEGQPDIQFSYDPASRIGICGTIPEPDGLGKIVVVTGGTSDMPVAEEAAKTAEFLGNEVERVYDAGVAGLHRLLSKLDVLMSAKVVIAIAGMEGALASVVGGLVDCPVIAVPTSIGYGASFNGLSALLSMLNSCASGVSVVNIDNGFGAAYQASMINHVK